eukprot:5282951-Amphidinium_carterae.1
MKEKTIGIHRFAHFSSIVVYLRCGLHHCVCWVVRLDAKRLDVIYGHRDFSGGDLTFNTKLDGDVCVVCTLERTYVVMMLQIGYVRLIPRQNMSRWRLEIGTWLQTVDHNTKLEKSRSTSEVSRTELLHVH